MFNDGNFWFIGVLMFMVLSWIMMWAGLPMWIAWSMIGCQLICLGLQIRGYKRG